MFTLGTASPVPVFGSTLTRPATGYSGEKSNVSTLDRLSVSAGCSRSLVDSLNQRRPSLQRLHTPFRGSCRFTREMCYSNCNDIRVVDDCILKDEFTAMQDRKLWETLLRFIDDISASIKNEDIDQLHKILHFDQGNYPQSPSRFFRSSVTVQGGAFLGSGFGADQQFDPKFDDRTQPTRSGEFREILGEIFNFFEIHFPLLRWDFKKQLEEEEDLASRSGTKFVAVQKMVREDDVHEVQPAKLNSRHLLQMKVEAERIERAENSRLFQEGKIKAIQPTALQMRCSAYRNKNDTNKKIAWQKIQLDWEADSARIALRLCDKTFEPSPKLKRAILRHELKHEEDQKRTEKAILVRPKTAPSFSHLNSTTLSSKKAAISNLKKAHADTQSFSEVDGDMQAPDVKDSTS